MASKKQKTHAERIRSLMEDAGIYEKRYELQIEQTADTLYEMDEIRTIIKKEGRTLDELKTAGIGSKKIQHPLYGPLNNLQTLLIRQLASLGLNKMSEKKADTKSVKQENDPAAEYFNTIK